MIVLKKIKGFLKKVIYILIFPYVKILNLIMNKNQVVFMSFCGKQYSDNPRAISEKLHELRPQTKIVWLLLEPEKYKNIVPNYVIVKKLTRFNRIYYLSTSKVWVDNDSLVYNKYVPKSKKQLFIETWHGDRGMKKCFYDVDGFIPTTKFVTQYKDYCDYIITASKLIESIYPTMFKYKGHFLKVGCPRNDILFTENSQLQLKVKNKLGIDKNSKVLLYAPTFRKNDINNFEIIDFKNVLSLLENKTKQKWTLVTRMHHAMKSIIETQEGLNFIDASSYFDMSDLLTITDLLITDYSSCAGDIILRNKPVVLYIYDYDYYKNEDRGLYFDLENSPFLIAKNNIILNKIILNLDIDNSEQYCGKIKEFYGCYEYGNASQKVCELIIKNLNK